MNSFRFKNLRVVSSSFNILVNYFHSHHAFPAPPQSFFACPAVQVAPELIGCLLMKRQEGGELLWGMIVETET